MEFWNSIWTHLCKKVEQKLGGNQATFPWPSSRSCLAFHCRKHKVLGAFLCKVGFFLVQPSGSGFTFLEEEMRKLHKRTLNQRETTNASLIVEANEPNKLNGLFIKGSHWISSISKGSDLPKRPKCPSYLRIPMLWSGHYLLHGTCRIYFASDRVSAHM